MVELKERMLEGIRTSCETGGSIIQVSEISFNRLKQIIFTDRVMEELYNLAEGRYDRVDSFPHNNYNRLLIIDFSDIHPAVLMAKCILYLENEL